jgi:hypothetical protein
VPITIFGVPEDADLIRRYRDAGVARVIFNLKPAKADEVLPVLDRCAGHAWGVHDGACSIVMGVSDKITGGDQD